MKIIINAKNLKLDEILQNFVEEKMASLEKFIEILKRDGQKKTLAEIFVEVEKETKHHKKGDIYAVKAMVKFPGKSLMAEAKKDDLFVAVTQAKDILKTEIEKYKFKKIDKIRRKVRKK